MSKKLNKIIESSNNFEFDYSSNVNGIPSIEEGDYLVAPVFKTEPLNSYKQAENPYDIAKYSIELKHVQLILHFMGILLHTYLT